MKFLVVREGRFGNVELHIGEKGEVEIESIEVAKNFPKITEFITKVGALNSTFENKRVNIIGTVKKISKASTFTRQNSTVGKVMRLTLVDETGEIPAVNPCGSAILAQHAACPFRHHS